MFANSSIKEGDVIEECHCVFIGNHFNSDGINRYCYSHNNVKMMVLGYGMIYNHSADNNSNFYYDEENNIQIFTAKRDILNGEEITVKYSDPYVKEYIK